MKTGIEVTVLKILQNSPAFFFISILKIHGKYNPYKVSQIIQNLRIGE